MHYALCRQPLKFDSLMSFQLMFLFRTIQYCTTKIQPLKKEGFLIGGEEIFHRTPLDRREKAIGGEEGQQLEPL